MTYIIKTEKYNVFPPDVVAAAVVLSRQGISCISSQAINFILFFWDGHHGLGSGNGETIVFSLNGLLRSE
jgi:hypothetical protein